MAARWLVLTAALAAALAISAAPASAAPSGLVGCGDSAEYPFLPWLDPIPYVLGPGGDFEAGSPAWQLRGGAKLVSGNEPWKVRKQSDALSLYLPPGASATSPEMCVGLAAVTLRYFSANGGSLLSPLKIEILYTTASGKQRSALVAQNLAGKSWSPGLVGTVYLLSNLGPLLSQDGLTTTVSFRLTSQSSWLLGSGKWRIDDFFVDPWLSGL